MEKWPIGVFASIDAGMGVHFEVAQELGVPTVQLHAPHQHNRTAKAADSFLKRCEKAGIRITAVFGGFDGESYADIPTTTRTVGIVPESTRADRLREMKEIADFASALDCLTVALHIGVVPCDRNGSDYRGLLDATRDLLDHIAANGQHLNLETGQEAADHLLQFLTDVQRDNLFINFDPANMILYGTGDPIEALKQIGRHVRSVHCKDAKWAAPPVRGKEWGTEVPLGEGDVGMESFLRTLQALGYHGPLTIEREIPNDSARQKKDIGHAVRLLETLRAKIVGAAGG